MGIETLELRCRPSVDEGHESLEFNWHDTGTGRILGRARAREEAGVARIITVSETDASPEAMLWIDRWASDLNAEQLRWAFLLRLIGRTAAEESARPTSTPESRRSGDQVVGVDDPRFRAAADEVLRERKTLLDRLA